MTPTTLDYAAGALALILHFITKGILSDGNFIQGIKSNLKYIVTSLIATAIGFLGASTIGPAMGFASAFTFCVTWGGGAGTVLFNLFQFSGKAKAAKATDKV